MSGSGTIIGCEFLVVVLFVTGQLIDIAVLQTTEMLNTRGSVEVKASINVDIW